MVDFGRPGSDSEESDDDDTSTCDDSAAQTEGTHQHHSVIMHLLTQLRLGMDLTKVTLPTFVLQRRSLLEMFADLIGHPELFLKIAACGSSKSRMVAVVRWYLSSVKLSRCGSHPSKPYNPVLGETFQCGWRVPRPSLQEQPVSQASGGGREKPDYVSVRFAAEQVSHHPPVSAFFFECPEKQLCVNGHIYTRSKFMGTFIEVNFLGDITLTVGGVSDETQARGTPHDKVSPKNSDILTSSDDKTERTEFVSRNAKEISSEGPLSAQEDEWVRLDAGGGENVQPKHGTSSRIPDRQLDIDESNSSLNKEITENISSNFKQAGVSSNTETYSLSMPSAFARSIITEPWSELGGRVTLACAESGCAANVVFHTKPFYGNSLHRVSGEVKGPAGETLCRIGGEWDKSVTFTYPEGYENLSTSKTSCETQNSKDSEGNMVEVLDVAKMEPVPRKRVRPLRAQDEGESRRLWQDVSTALRRRDMHTATAHKQRLETLQRNYEAKRLAKGEPYCGKLFRKLQKRTERESPGLDETRISAETKKGIGKDNQTGHLLNGTEHWVYKKLPFYATEVCGG
ncbi:hypothetical protein HAZT_HAZT008878, partial [Hyalella azteca]